MDLAQIQISLASEQDMFAKAISNVISEAAERRRKIKTDAMLLLGEDEDGAMNESNFFMIIDIIKLASHNLNHLLECSGMNSKTTKAWLRAEELPDSARRRPIAKMLLSLAMEEYVQKKSCAELAEFVKGKEGSVSKLIGLSRSELLGSKLISFSEFKVSGRTENCLKNYNIVTVGELLLKSKNEMLRTPNFGNVGMGELENFLSMIGLDFCCLSHEEIKSVEAEKRNRQ